MHSLNGRVHNTDKAHTSRQLRHRQKAASQIQHRTSASAPNSRMDGGNCPPPTWSSTIGSGSVTPPPLPLLTPPPMFPCMGAGSREFAREQTLAPTQREHTTRTSPITSLAHRNKRSAKADPPQKAELARQRQERVGPRAECCHQSRHRHRVTQHALAEQGQQGRDGPRDAQTPVREQQRGDRRHTDRSRKAGSDQIALRPPTSNPRGPSSGIGEQAPPAEEAYASSTRPSKGREGEDIAPPRGQRSGSEGSTEFAMKITGATLQVRNFATLHSCNFAYFATLHILHIVHIVHMTL